MLPTCSPDGALMIFHHVKNYSRLCLSAANCHWSYRKIRLLTVPLLYALCTMLLGLFSTFRPSSFPPLRDRLLNFSTLCHRIIMDKVKSKITLLSFGQLTDITGHSTWQMEDITDTDQLKKILIEKHPAFANSKYLLAVNMEIIRGNVKLNPGDVVALLPPFSGG